ncbi:MAG: hypothetical protein R2769_13065 [Saprospiraceae bacterium]
MTTQDNPAYPWPFSTTIVYKISEEKGFEMSLSVINQSNENIPMGLGWHPYFRLGGNVDDWKLEVPNCRKILVDDKMIPTGGMEDFQFSGAIAENRWDTCFFKMNRNPLKLK